MPAVKVKPFGSVPKRRRTGTGPDDEPEVPSVHPKFGGEDLSLPSPTARLDNLVMLAVTDDEDEGPSAPCSAGSHKIKGKLPEAPNRGMPPTPGNEDALCLSSEGTTGRARSSRGTHGGGGGDTGGGGTRSQAAKSKAPPSFQPSPPISPSPTTAAAAAAAAAAAGANAKTWIQDDNPGPRTTRSRSDLRVTVTDNMKVGSDSENGTPGGENDTPDDDTPGGSRRSLRRRSANPRFDSYCTATKGPFEVQVPPTKTNARKKVDLGLTGISPRDLDAKIERVLGRLEANLGRNHPEVGKVLLQVARLCFCQNRREKAEHYLLRSWDVFKCYTDKSTDLQQVFESFLDLFEEYKCSAKAMESLRKEMYALSPSGMLSASLADGISSW